MYCQYVYTKEKLKFLLKWQKIIPQEMFLLRPHPSEKEKFRKTKKII